MKRIVICADDYGQNTAISQAIVELLRDNRLSATSCLVTTPAWPGAAKWLAPLISKADIGLHFNLTEGKPLSDKLSKFFSLKELIIKSNLRQLDQKDIAAELRAQLDNFTNQIGQLPDFIDGHQHVHQFPIIRDAVFEVYEERLRQNGSYLRCTYDPSMLTRVKDVAYVKQLIVQLCGGIQFRQRVVELKIPHNTSFAGIYDFKNSYEYISLFPRFLEQVQTGGLVMCHPGLLSSEEPDLMATARHNEYLYLSSLSYLDTISQHHINIVRFKNL
jgi:predicted glycoside hydrolase/deacetylase ChbG (UPF0249 family)